MDLREYLVNGGYIERDGNVVRLVIPPTGDHAYTDAQLNDYDPLARLFADMPPQHLRIRARFSHTAGALKGTAGFGFWNHPFTQTGGVIEPPSNVWFFYGSPESNLQLAPNVPGNGWKASSLTTSLSAGNAGRPNPITRLMVAAGNVALRVPGVSRLALAAARRMVSAHETRLDCTMAEWHDYHLDWRRDEVIWRVDGLEVLRATGRVPHGPLGFVAWIDNYRATATADGQYEFAYVAVPETQWLELRIENGD